MKLILLGAPGAGKGTQADILCEKLDIPTISTGNILRAAVKNGTPTGMKAKAFMDAGQLVPDEVIIGIISERLARLKNDLSQRDETIKKLEEASGDAEAIREELRRYKEEDAARKKAEKEAETDRILTEAAEQALDGIEFVNEFTRNHFVAELKKAIADPANKGKRASKLFEEMTKDLDHIFRNPQLEKLKIHSVDHNGFGNVTVEHMISAAFKPKT